MSFFNFKSKQHHKTLLGIDVGVDAVRMVELSHINGQYQFCSNASVGFTAEQADDWQQPAVLSALTQVLEQRRYDSRQVAIALPYTTVLSKVVELDKTLTCDEVLLQIQQQAQQFFQHPLSDLALDFEVLPFSARDERLQQIRWVVARRQSIHSRVVVMKTLGLLPVAVEVDVFSLQRLCMQMVTQRPMVYGVLQGCDTGILYMVVDEKGLHYMQYASELTIASAQQLLRGFEQSAMTVFVDVLLISGKGITDVFIEQLQVQWPCSIERLSVSSVINTSIDLLGELALSTGLAMRVGL